MAGPIQGEWRAPGIVAVVTAIVFVIVGATHGWVHALAILPISLALALFFYFMASGTTDYGAFLRGRLDERQQEHELHIAAFIGRVLAVAVVVEYVVALITRTAIWPSLTLICVMIAAFVAARILYREPSIGAD
ncbi:MAG: hypothetical protein QM774_03205 [Gordonia sp. (in: high G+C Gram-positive bacteria)]|uniref:hypothetical protein n=1 Tax=Gordonia sp. (in: high G+C Gram-positive bacteria) TaxID=84139 RepID=UPI0039E66F0E